MRTLAIDIETFCSDVDLSEIFKLYLLGFKQKQIGEKLNLSQSYVSRLIKNMSSSFKANYEKGAC